MANFATLVILILLQLLSVVFRLFIRKLMDDEFELMGDGNVQFYDKL